MATRTVRFRVGPQRITSGLAPWQAGYTRAIREQMKAVEGSYSRLVETLQANTEEAVRQMLQPVFDRSQELVPVDKGPLKASGYIEVRRTRGRVVGEVGYGKGGSPPYAPLVHEDLDKQQLLSLVFKSGLSTSPVITDISGRGLGLAIVEEKVNKLGGQISVETEPGAGTRVRILLPLTLATFRGILIECADRLFVIPTASVKRAVRIEKDEIKTIENRETIALSGEALSLARLSDVLGLPSTEKPGETRDDLTVLVLTAAGKQIAFGVDQLLREQEILVKGLGKQLARVRNIAGATILGSGTVVPVLNVGDLIKSAEQRAGTPASTPAGATTESEEVKTRTRSILVVDDSITSRTLLKNILELAGYDVQTFIDGVAAFTAPAPCIVKIFLGRDGQAPGVPGSEVYWHLEQKECTLAQGIPMPIATTVSVNMDKGESIYCITTDVAIMGWSVEEFL